MNWESTSTYSFSITNRGYTAHEHLLQFGLINMNGRMYDPLLARMLSPDPFVTNPALSQDYNRYSYVRNNPLKYTDPSGYFVIDPIPCPKFPKRVVNWINFMNKIDGFFSEIIDAFSWGIGFGWQVGNGFNDGAIGNGFFGDGLGSYCGNTNSSLGSGPHRGGSLDWAITPDGRIRPIKSGDNSIYYIDKQNNRKAQINYNPEHIINYSAIQRIDGTKWPDGFLVEFTNENTAKTFFEFFADNTSVEGGLYGLERNNEKIWMFMTTFSPKVVASTTVLINYYFDYGWGLFFDSHNHPSGVSDPSDYYGIDGERWGDMGRRDWFKAHHSAHIVNAEFYIYTRGGNYTPY